MTTDQMRAHLTLPGWQARCNDTPSRLRPGELDDYIMACASGWHVQVERFVSADPNTGWTYRTAVMKHDVGFAPIEWHAVPDAAVKLFYDYAETLNHVD